MRTGFIYRKEGQTTRSENLRWTQTEITSLMVACVDSVKVSVDVELKIGLEAAARRLSIEVEWNKDTGSVCALMSNAETLTVGTPVESILIEESTSFSVVTTTLADPSIVYLS
jgi:hypothetical protein